MTCDEPRCRSFGLSRSRACGSHTKLRPARLITVGDVADTVGGWARRTGLSRWRIYARLKSGWDPARAVMTPPGAVDWTKHPNAIVVEVDGERDSLSGWGRRNGLTLETICGRLDRGWAPARAVTEPAGATKHRLGRRKAA